VAVAAATLPLLARLVPNALPSERFPRSISGSHLRAVLIAITDSGSAPHPPCEPGSRRSSKPFATAREREAPSSAGAERPGGSGGHRVDRPADHLGTAHAARLADHAIPTGFLPRDDELRTVLPLPHTGHGPPPTLYGRVLGRWRAPGVSSVPTSRPADGENRRDWGVEIKGAEKGQKPTNAASLRYVRPVLFDARHPLRRGRDIAESDTPGSLWVAVVSESMSGDSGRTWIRWPEVRICQSRANGRRRRWRRTRPGTGATAEPQCISARQVPDDSIIGYIPQQL